MRRLRGVLAWVGLALAMCGLSFIQACGPTAAPPTPTPTVDAFAVVRATSQAAYQSGQAALAAGNYLQACVDLDAAKTNDPDNRPEIQQALQQALAYCLTPPPTATEPPQQRTIVIATVGVSGAGTPTAAAAQATLPAATQATLPAATQAPLPAATGASTPTNQSTATT